MFCSKKIKIDKLYKNQLITDFKTINISALYTFFKFTMELKNVLGFSMKLYQMCRKIYFVAMNWVVKMIVIYLQAIKNAIAQL